MRGDGLVAFGSTPIRQGKRRGLSTASADHGLRRNRQLRFPPYLAPDARNPPSIGIAMPVT
jgi:hypothetical protein